MNKNKKARKSKIMVGVKCQCQDWAVQRPVSLIRKLICKKCGKEFKTNREVNICFNAKSKK